MSQKWPNYDLEYPLRPSALADVRAQNPRMPAGGPGGGIPLSDKQQLEQLPAFIAVPPPPRQDASPPAIIIQDQGVEVCRYEQMFAQDMTFIGRVFPPQDGGFTPPTGGASISVTDATNPFNNIFTASFSLPANIAQALEVIGMVRFGHQGASLEIPINFPLGQIVRVPTLASFLNVFARTTTRYYPLLTDGIAGGVRSWLVAPSGSNFVRNTMFDNPPAASAGITFDPAHPILPIMMQGFVGRSFTAPIPPQRIFFGWVESGALQNTRYICPVPRGAGTVLLMADASTVNNDPGGTAPFQGFGLTFNQICQATPTSTRRVLNFPPNATIPLRADCVAIEVVNLTVPTVAVPFELQFDVNF